MSLTVFPGIYLFLNRLKKISPSFTKNRKRNKSQLKDHLICCLPYGYDEMGGKMSAITSICSNEQNVDPCETGLFSVTATSESLSPPSVVFLQHFLENEMETTATEVTLMPQNHVTS